MARYERAGLAYIPSGIPPLSCVLAGPRRDHACRHGGDAEDRPDNLGSSQRHFERRDRRRCINCGRIGGRLPELRVLYRPAVRERGMPAYGLLTIGSAGVSKMGGDRQ